MSDTIPPSETSFHDAWRCDDSFEVLWHTSGQDYLCAIAPHAGDIEASTDQAAIELYKNMPEEACSMWAFYGFGDDAFENYHVTSSKITPDRFPALEGIFDVGFQHCVSFHVGSGLDHIEVGGLADRGFRARVAETLEEAVSEKWEAVVDYEQMEFPGKSERNITNQLTEGSQNGVQIELPIYAARNRRKNIAQALASFYSDFY